MITGRPPATQARILVVVDDPDARASARRFLEERHRVEAVPDPRAALVAIRGRAPDLVLVAATEPRRDVLGLLRELRSTASTSGIPVILLAGDDQEEWRIEGLSAGADDCVSTPLDRRELLARVGVHLTRSRLHGPLVRGPSRDERGPDEAASRDDELRARAERSRAALLGSEERFRTFLRQSRDGIVVIDGQGTLLEWNEGQEEITGIPRSEAVGRPIWEVQHRLAPDELRTAEFLRAAREKTLAGLDEGVELKRTLEEEIQRPDGTRRTVQSTLFGLRSDGELLAAGICRDITARKHLEEELRESEARFATMADSAPVMIWVSDEEGNNQFVNRAYRDFFGKTAEEVEGSGWQPLLHPDDAAAYVAAVRAAMRERTPLHARVRVQHRDGEWRWLESYGALRFSSSGELLGMVGTSLDVTGRKVAEEALERSREDLRHAQGVAHVGSWRINVQGSVLDWSEETYRLFGVAPGTPMTYETFLAAIHPEDRACVDRSWQAALRGSPYDVEHRIVVGGEVKWVREVAHLEFAPDGTLAGGFGTVQDITDRKAMEQALADASRRKDEFLAVLSHELRNPLAPVRSSLYVLARTEPGGEQARRMQAIIERQVSQLTRLVDDLLDVTRISRGKIQLQRERVELGELVRRTVEDHRATFTASGVELAGRVASSPMWLQADATRIAQIVGNLLGNAAKFTPRGGRVEVALERDGAAALLRVRDSGVGISREMLHQIFEPFTQADRTLDRARGGLGLGLALVKGLAELHGGSVSAASEGHGRGAEFTVRLPLQAGAEEPAAARRPGPAQPRRVLIIEDNLDAADCLKEALELAGHDVRVAYEGPEGLARARTFRPEVVLCDIGLPDVDGYEVARAFRSDPALAHTFLVALSGYALPDDVQRAVEAGFDRHVAKPPSFERLEELIEDAPRRPPDAPAIAPTRPAAPRD